MEEDYEVINERTKWERVKDITLYEDKEEESSKTIESVGSMIDAGVDQEL